MVIPDLDTLFNSLPAGVPSSSYMLGCGLISKNKAGLVVFIPTALVIDYKSARDAGFNVWKIGNSPFLNE